MRPENTVARSSRSLLGTALALAVILWCLVATARAAEPTDIVRVEEDWELVVTEPDYDSNSPQATTVLSSGADTAGDYVTFEINHGSQPEYAPGGLQLQLWNGETHVASQKHTEGNLMSTPNETVRWTQSMSFSGNQLVFEVSGGSSATWGNFGGSGQLKTRVNTTATNLNQYTPDVSVRNSGVGFAGNRVQSLKLKKVRVTLASGEVVENATVRTVWEQSDD